MKQIAQEQKYILLIAPVGRGRNKRQTAGCDEGKAFPLLIVLIYLYLEKLAKQQWIMRMYVSAASETGYTGIRADEEARKSLLKTRERMVKNISRETFDAGEYVKDLIGSSLIGKLNTHLDTIAGRTEGVHFAEKIYNKNTTSSAENLLNAMKVLEETSAMMKKTACKKAAQDAGILLDQKIEEAYSGIETTNKNVEESIDSMLYGAGYLKSGNLYARKVLAHSYLVQDVYKIQAVAGYNWYNTAIPELRISSAMFEGLETDGIITLMNTATMELEDWQARIFGVHDGVREIKGEIEKHIGSKQDYGSEIGRIMFQYDRNEKEKDAGKAEFEAAPWDKQITEAPCSWVEVPSLRSVVTTATAVYSAVVTTVATTALSVASFGTLSAPMAALCAAGIGAAITLSAEATFAAADIAGGYRDWDEVGKQLAISAATSMISAAGGAAGAAVQGIGGIGGALLKTGVSVATSATSTVATNAIQYAGDWDGFASSMSSFDTWSGVITSGAGALVGNCLDEINLGTRIEKINGEDGKVILNKIYTKADGFNSAQIGSIQSFNSLAGGLASSALSYGLTGEATFNILNISDFGAGTSCGLLEVSVGNKGIKTRLGTGGTDISAGTLISSLSGIKNISVNEKIKKAAKDNNMAQSATALRMLYGFGDEKGLELLDDVLSKKASLAVGDGTGNAQTVTENGKRTVYLNGYSDNMTREEKLKLGITLGHEAYRDGVVSDTATQMIETRNAVAGHTDMMTRMLGDSLYSYTFSGIIAGDTNLQMDMLARSLGDEVFNDYVDGMYDSSADYWRVLNNGDLLDDGLDDRVSFEDGRETIYYGKRSKQGTLEKFLGIKATEGYKTLLKDAGYSFNDGWSVNGESTIGTVISRESIENQIAAGKITNTQYYTPPNLIESGINSVKNTISSIFGDAKERQILKEKQKEKIEDPKYQQGSKGPKNFEGATSETTWCNMSTLGITFDTCYDLSMALRNENDIYGENTNANAMYDNLAKAAAKEGSKIVEITPELAQILANKGYTVVGSWQNPDLNKSGHIATVESGHKYNANEGPYFGNVGSKDYTGVEKKAIDAFGPKRLSEIKYYYCPTQFSRRRIL